MRTVQSPPSRRVAFITGIVVAAIGGVLLLWSAAGFFGWMANRAAPAGLRAALLLRAVGGSLAVAAGFAAMTLGSGFSDGLTVSFDDVHRHSDVDTPDSAMRERIVVKLRCRDCRALNSEDRDVCDHCGASL